MRTRSRIVSVVLAGAVTLAGCSIAQPKSDVSAGSLADIASLKGKTFTVGGKEFTEQLILCQITIQALQSAGADAKEKCGLNGSDTTRAALTSGSIDLYWEYTGTAWISYLKHTDPIPDADAQYKAVADEDKKNDIVWLDPAPYNSTYTIVAKTDVAEQHGIKSISDYAELAKSDPGTATMCAATEFLARNDGWPGLEKTYGFTLPKDSLATVAEGTLYDSAAKGSACNFAEGVTTDGRIQALKLTVLEDDKSFFPVYNPAPNVRKSVADANPDLAKILKPVADALDITTIQKLSADVDIKGEQPADVAEQWLKDKKFVG
ncbi:MAG TPA: glycine betaine ABC transporter substrate-binding protein [Actinophytocola sp.]|jgi:osmoprotectant transport system substrate-binding protein|nr:glycine betaine ABC transporter substrate-binding protein [Actinophytocola sp.]